MFRSNSQNTIRSQAVASVTICIAILAHGATANAQSAVGRVAQSAVGRVAQSAVGRVAQSAVGRVAQSAAGRVSLNTPNNLTEPQAAFAQSREKWPWQRKSRIPRIIVDDDGSSSTGRVSLAGADSTPAAPVFHDSMSAPPVDYTNQTVVPSAPPFETAPFETAPFQTPPFEAPFDTHQHQNPIGFEPGRVGLSDSYIPDTNTSDTGMYGANTHDSGQAQVDFAPSVGFIPYAERVEYDSSIAEEEPPFRWHIGESLIAILEAPAKPFAHITATVLDLEHYEPHTKLDEIPLPPQPLPERPALLVERGEDFLGGSTTLSRGIELPTGAIWRPALWMFGTYRTGLNHVNSSNGQVTEWANRLDLFAQINLSGTERIVYGIRPLDEEIGSSRTFSGIDFRTASPASAANEVSFVGIDGFNADTQTLFFEGDYGEIFPNLDPFDSKQLDYGFSIGRQPLVFQRGLLLNEDRIDALTITRNSLSGSGNLNMRITGLYAWNQIHRTNFAGGNQPTDAQMAGLFSETDFKTYTINMDAVFVSDSSAGGSDMFAIGASGTRRINGYHNTYNNQFHVLASLPTDTETQYARNGVLLFNQLSWTPHHTNDLIYVNSFWGIDDFTSATRAPLAGGPLGQAGILFSAAGLGRFPPALGNSASKAVGGSIGYQLFFDHAKKQIIFELGGRSGTGSSTEASAFAAGARYQAALDQHWIALVDCFASKSESTEVANGIRFELLKKF